MCGMGFYTYSTVYKTNVASFQSTSCYHTMNFLGVKNHYPEVTKERMDHLRSERERDKRKKFNENKT